jgi:hypothetical protein
MWVDIVFWTLGAIALVVAAGSCIASSKSEREFNKIINKDNESKIK